MFSSKYRRALSRSGVVAFSIRAASVAYATPVSSIQFNDGKVLDVAGTVGSGQYTSYLAVDFNNGPSAVDSTEVAYQYNSNTSVTGYQMMQDILAAESPTFTFQSTSFSFGHEISNFQYQSTVGASGGQHYYALYTGDYDASTVSSSNPQGVDLAYSDFGIDDVMTYDGSASDGTFQFFDWIDAADYADETPPTLPETAVPEPAFLLSGGVVATCALLRRRRGFIA